MPRGFANLLLGFGFTLVGTTISLFILRQIGPLQRAAGLAAPTQPIFGGFQRRTTM